MQKLSKKETLLRERDEAERAEEYAKTQRRQYRLRFGALTPFLISCVKYLVLARVILAVFFTGYIMWEKGKVCEACTICTTCNLPHTGASIW